MKTTSIVTFVLVIVFLNFNLVLAQENSEYGIQKATKLESPINTSEYGEYAPTISADGKTLIFETNKNGRWQLYISEKTDTGWSVPVRMDSVNSNNWDGGPFLSYDRNYLILSSDRDGGLGDVDIWISQRLGDGWSKPVNIGPPINTSEYDGFASMSPDGNELYFMRDAAASPACPKTNHYDIYHSRKTDGKWSVPKKLPYPINTEACEEMPIILADGITLIFSSTRAGGYGDYDLYKSEKQSDGSWSTPINLGSFINTPEGDALVSIPASGDIMYYATGGSFKTDLYTVPIPLKMQPTKVITVTGKVVDARTRNPLKAEVQIINTETGAVIKTIESNKIDGTFIVILNKGQKYDVSVSADNYMFYSTGFDLRTLEDYEEYNQDILLQPIEVDARIILNNIFFELDSYSLLKDSQYELDRIFKIMEQHQGLVVEIAGHTDNIASEKYNLDLSKRRAQSVADYLTGQGIKKQRFIITGYGEDQPIADNSTEEGRKQNRRVEFTVKQK